MDKKIYTINDNELLYRIKNYDEEALEIMFQKYENLICSKIIKYHFPLNHKEDYLQEGRLVLMKAIETYREDYDKTFTRYFELLLQNRFNTLYKKNKKYENHIFLVEIEKIDDKIKEEKKYNEIDMIVDKLSKLEKDIYQYYFKENYSIQLTAEKIGISKKQVYNSITRIKDKMIKAMKKR